MDRCGRFKRVGTKVLCLASLYMESTLASWYGTFCINIAILGFDKGVSETLVLSVQSTLHPYVLMSSIKSPFGE